MLLGEFRHSLDAKGRVFVPARWREEVGDDVVLAQGLEHCIYLFPRSRFEQVADSMRQRPVEGRRNRDYTRLLAASAAEEQMDRQGRITIPSSLRRWAGLGSSVVLIGVLDRAEIWDSDAWETYKEQKDTEYEEIAETLSQP